MVGNIGHIPLETVCDATLKSQTVRSLWEYSYRIFVLSSTFKLYTETVLGKHS